MSKTYDILYPPANVSVEKCGCLSKKRAFYCVVKKSFLTIYQFFAIAAIVWHLCWLGWAGTEWPHSPRWRGDTHSLISRRLPKSSRHPSPSPKVTVEPPPPTRCSGGGGWKWGRWCRATFLWLLKHTLPLRTIVALGWVTVRPVTGELTRVTLRQLFLSSLTEATTQMLPNILSFLKENLARVIAMPVVGRWQTVGRLMVWEYWDYAQEGDFGDN